MKMKIIREYWGEWWYDLRHPPAWMTWRFALLLAAIVFVTGGVTGAVVVFIMKAIRILSCG